MAKGNPPPIIIDGNQVCPWCHSPVKERTARETGERYLGCTNPPPNCTWNNRSY